MSSRNTMLNKKIKSYFFSIVERIKSTLMGLADVIIWFKHKLADIDTTLVLVRSIEERSISLESQLDTALILIRTNEERSRTLESQLDTALILIRTNEERSRTLEYMVQKVIFASSHQVDQLQKLYVESMSVVLGLDQLETFNASRIFYLKTDYPIALDSNDHISPDSTMEGISRPTLFVQNCINVLGKDIKCLDLGTGAAGLIYEYVISGIFAVGIDGSDFCRVNRIGYWPLLLNNLYTCDITKPFSFLSRDEQKQINFDVITMWEVLEHIAENDLLCLLNNIRRHLSKGGYFIGSISLIEYEDSDGNPYHVTLKPRDWWKQKFIGSDLVILDSHPFNEKLFCRGNGPRFQDYHNYAKNPKDGFWFVAQSKSDIDQMTV